MKKKFSEIPKIVWFQLFLLALGYAFYSANRLSFGVGLKAVAASISLTSVQLGTISTIFTLGQALIDIPAGYLADRFGRKRLLVMSMVGLGCMTALVTTSASFIGAAFWRFMFGVAEGCWNIVMYSVAGSIFPAARAMLNGLMMTFYSIGAYVGPAYYGWSLETTGEWSVGLQHMGAVTVVFGLLLIFHVMPQSSPLLYVVGAVMGIGLHAIYVLGYTIAQDGVSRQQIGLATGIVGASSYFLSFFSGLLMGFLTSTLGHAAALDIIVVAFEAVLVVVAFFMKETQHRAESK